MRLAHAALLTALPAVAFGARVIQQSTDDAPPPPPPVPAAVALDDDALTVRGDRGRARAFSEALADLDAEVLLGDAACTEEIVSSSPQTARYAAGSRRYENPDYVALSATQAEHTQAISAVSAEQATLRAGLELHTEREVLQDERVALARRGLRDAQHDLDDANAALSEARTRLSRSHAAASAIEGYGQERSALESQIRDLTRSIAVLEAQLAEASAAHDAAAAAAEKLAAAQARLASATAAAQQARAAMHAARDNPALTDAERAAIRKQARDAQAAQEAARGDVEAAERIASRADGDGHGGRHLGRTLRKQQAELAAAQQARAALQPPSAHLHALAADAQKLEHRVRREASQAARAEQAVGAANQQLHIQQSRADTLASQRGEREATLAALIAQEEGLRAELLSTEAAMASVAPMRTRTLWEEASYTVETRARTCTADATLLWPDGTFTQAHAQIRDTDTTHGGAEAAGVAADALDFGRTDAARIAEADLDLIAQLRDAAVADGAVADAGSDTGW